ncbi:MAG: O-antigen ligase family protein [Thermoleophilia bacterium]|nr:O-antigen ligase family protein [Thermoleophilia bacterium]
MEVRPHRALAFDSPAWPIGILAVGIWVFWAAASGGVTPSVWGLIGIGLVLLLGLALALPAPAGLRRLRIVALAALAALVGWSFLSLLWADVPGDAWEGADKTLLYAAGFAVFALWPWSDRSVTATLALFAGAIAVLGAVTLCRAALAADPGAFIREGGRLAEPVDYANANTALWTSALWPAVYLAGCRRVPAPLRALFMAAAGLLLELAVLGQSRGWLLVLPVAAAAFILLARQRLRMLLGFGLAGIATAAISSPLLTVFERADAGAPPAGPLDRAAVFVLISCACLGAAGWVWAILDARFALDSAYHRLAGAAAALLVLGAVAAATAVALTRTDSPGGWIREQWNEFATSYVESETGTSRFTDTLSGDRYQQWRVALAEFREHPVQGIGADNFAVPYLLRRDDNLHEPRYPHSTPLRLLSQLGIVGTALFAVFCAGALALAWRRRSRSDAIGGGAIGAALAVFVYWLLHGSVDVLWEVPALAGPAFGLLGLAGAARESSDARLAWAHRAAIPRRLTRAGLAALVVAAAVSLALPWLAASYTEASGGIWKRDPDVAYGRLGLAASLNPLSASPLLVEGSIALERGELDRARDAFDGALEREAKSWYAAFQLAMVGAVSGDFQTASTWIARAQKLNPRDPLVEIARRMIRLELPLDPSLFNRLYRTRENRHSVDYILNQYFGRKRFTLSDS